VEEGEQLLEELRRSSWVDTSVDWETVRQGLAEGRPAIFLLARDRHNGTLVVRHEPDDARLIEEMTAIARRPYVEMPWPQEPDVDLSRLTADFVRTTGRTLDLSLRWEQFPDGGHWVCDMAIDGRRSGSTWFNVSEDSERMLADLADHLCEGWLHEEIWGGWPLCVRHPTRPMWAKRNERGRASWICEAVAADQVEIGQL
jgi:hypothetical protein